MGAAEALAFCRAQLGKPYVWAAEGPDSFDCSGLIQAACRAGGVTVPRVTYDQIFSGTEVSQSDLLPGDLVFPDIGHVQMYSGNNMIIEAPHSGAFVQEVKLWGFWRARRVFSDGGSIGAGGTSTVGITTVGDPITGSAHAVLQFGRIADHLTSATWWKRAGVFIFGVMIIVFALYWLNRDRVNHAVGEVIKTAGAVV